MGRKGKVCNYGQIFGVCVRARVSVAGIEQVAMGMLGTEEREWLSVEAKKMPTSHEEIKGDSGSEKNPLQCKRHSGENRV